MRKHQGARLAATLAGQRGVVRRKFILYESDIMGTEIRELSGVSDIQVNLSNYRDWAWELTATVTDNMAFDPYTGYVKAVMEITTTADGLARFPLGVYRFSSPSMRHKSVTGISLSGRSIEDLLSGDFVGSYLVPAGSSVLSAARAALLAATPQIPASMINLPTETVPVVLTTDLFFDAFADASKCYRLQIVNGILNAGGFSSIHADRYGRLASNKLGDYELHDAPPSVFYSTDTELYVEIPAGGAKGYLLAEQMITTDEVTDDYDDTNFANRVVVMSNDANQATPIYAVMENNDPQSPFSIQNLGRVVTLDPITLQNIASTAEAGLYALVALAQASGRYRKLGIKTLPDPRRGIKETYQVQIALARRGGDGKQVPVYGKWPVIGWTLSEGGMDHELARVQGGLVEGLPLENLPIHQDMTIAYGDWQTTEDFDPPHFRSFDQEDILDDVPESFEELE